MAKVLNSAGELVPLWTMLPEPVCHRCSLTLMNHMERTELYAELVESGLSVAEAYGTCWPEDEGPCFEHKLMLFSEGA